MNINTLWEIVVGDEFKVTVNRAVDHMKHTSSVLSKSWVMGNHNNSIASLVDAMKLLHNSFGTLRIETTGRLIGKNDFRIGDQGASNGDTLLLTTRKLIWIIIFFGLKIEIF